jgi:hypothetical protein
MARRQPMTAFGQFAEAIALVSQGKPGHIVDTLIAERGQKIVHNPLWPLLRPFLYTLLRYNKAIKFANDLANMPGFAVLRVYERSFETRNQCQPRRTHTDSWRLHSGQQSSDRHCRRCGGVRPPEERDGRT